MIADIKIIHIFALENIIKRYLFKLEDIIYGLF